MGWWKEFQKGVKEGFLILISPLISFLERMGVRPVEATLLSIPFGVISFYFFFTGHIRMGGAFLLLGALWDTIDGELARRTGKVTRIGAFIDSFIDRFFEFIIYIGIFLSPLGKNYTPLLFILLFATLMVSYLRAKAESLNVNCTIGIFSRVIRVLLLGIGALLFPHWLPIILWIMLIGTSFTVVERVVYVLRRAS